MHFTWLKYFTYRLVLVLALNYRQHILSPAEVRNVCYSLAELYVRCVCLNAQDFATSDELLLAVLKAFVSQAN
jgi:hypothetical protein